MIRTQRLQLIPATVALALADLAGRAELERRLQATVPESWPPELYDAAAIEYTLQQLRQQPEPHGWGQYYFIRAEPDLPSVVIGIGGYKAPPDAEGSVEIGYSVVPEYRRHGYATEATFGLVAHAFADDRVRQVIAETLPELVGSIGVLEKTGFTFVGEGSEAGVIRYALRRERYSASSPSGNEHSSAHVVIG